MGIPQVINVYVDANKVPPAEMTMLERLISACRFWHQWTPEFRHDLIREKCGNPMDCGDGVLGALLIGLEHVDPKVLQTEVDAVERHAEAYLSLRKEP